MRYLIPTVNYSIIIISSDYQNFFAFTKFINSVLYYKCTFYLDNEWKTADNSCTSVNEL